jgi:hypothetical protein
MGYIFLYLATLSCLLLSGCVTGYQKLSNVDSSLNSIVQAVENLIPGGSRFKSRNGREIESYYFNRIDLDKKIDPISAPERTFIRVRIFGDRKPYDVELGVFVERLDEGEYVNVGHDEKLAESYVKWLTEKLAKSRGELNAIDVFRPF